MVIIYSETILIFTVIRVTQINWIRNKYIFNAVYC